MKFRTLEKELTARILAHKVAMSKAALVRQYIDKEKASGGILLSDNYIEEQALDMADTIVHKAMGKGKLDLLYNDSWEFLKDRIPDSFCLMRDYMD